MAISDCYRCGGTGRVSWFLFFSKDCDKCYGCGKVFVNDPYLRPDTHKIVSKDSVKRSSYGAGDESVLHDEDNTLVIGGTMLSSLSMVGADSSDAKESSAQESAETGGGESGGAGASRDYSDSDTGSSDSGSSDSGSSSDSSSDSSADYTSSSSDS